MPSVSTILFEDLRRQIAQRQAAVPHDGLGLEHRTRFVERGEPAGHSKR